MRRRFACGFPFTGENGGLTYGLGVILSLKPIIFKNFDAVFRVFIQSPETENIIIWINMAFDA